MMPIRSTHIDRRFLLLLIAWGIVDLVCAMLCEIHADEAYYRLYGQFLDWGYFDHPPMVALLTRASDALVCGSSLIAKNLSVRLMTVLLHIATMVLIWKTIDTSKVTKNVEAFFIICGSMVMFSAYGFITAPDAPLLFFAALFFYSYKRYLQTPSWSLSLLLGIAMAGMVYSKYMAVLVIGFVIISNLRLMKDVRLWVSVLFALALLTPHFYWQYSHHFPSMTYHLVDRASTGSWLYVLEYIPNQLLVFNPLAYVLMWILAIRFCRSTDAFNRAMAYEIIGFQLFFMLMTIRGHVEPHWTMVTSIPAIILICNEWNNSATSSLMSRPWIKKTMIAMCALVFITRIILCMNVLPARTGLANKQPYYQELHEQAKGYPIIFDGSFQRASLYRFYYPDEAILVRQATDRYTQFDLLHLEQQWMGKPACIMRGKTRFVEALTEDDLR